MRSSKLVVAAALTALAVSPARAAGPDAPSALEECAACHVLYPPQYLPQRSWAALLARLDDHFGEIATVSADKLASISAYLPTNAADAPSTKGGQRFLRGVRPDETPLRITDLPWWQELHVWVNFDGIAATKVKSASNCAGCHENGRW
jgi:hypothetical protein